MTDTPKPEGHKSDTKGLPESGTVTVACNWPTGIVLELCEKTTVMEAVMGGGMKEVDFWARTGKAVTVHGPALAKGAVPKCLIVGGYALTSGVDAQFFREWVTQNASNPLVQRGHVKAFASEDRAKGWAAEHAEVRTGFEPLVPGLDAKGLPNDKRLPKSGRRGISQITTDTQAPA